MQTLAAYVPGSPILVILLGVAVQVFLVVLFVKMYYHVKALRYKSDKSSAFGYLEKAMRLRAAADACPSSSDDRTSYLQAYRRNLNIALYLFGQGKIGEIPAALRAEYDGKSSFGDFIEDYIRQNLQQADDLLRDTEKKDPPAC